MGNQELDPQIVETEKTMAGPDRREFFKLAVGSALSAAGFLSSTRTASANVHKNAPGIKLCAQTIGQAE
jgi:primosomal replication protein N